MRYDICKIQFYIINLETEIKVLSVFLDSVIIKMRIKFQNHSNSKLFGKLEGEN